MLSTVSLLAWKVLLRQSMIGVALWKAFAPELRRTRYRSHIAKAVSEGALEAFWLVMVPLMNHWVSLAERVAWGVA